MTLPDTMTIMLPLAKAVADRFTFDMDGNAVITAPDPETGESYVVYDAFAQGMTMVKVEGPPWELLSILRALVGVCERSIAMEEKRSREADTTQAQDTAPGEAPDPSIDKEESAETSP